MNNSGNTTNNDVNALLQQAAKLFQQGDLQQAQSCASSLLKLSPNHVGAIQLLGGIKAGLGDYQAAINLFSDAVKINPRLPNNFNNLSYVLHITGRLEEARQASLKAIQLNPEFAEAYNMLSVILKDLGQLEQAINSVQRALQLRSDFIEAYNTLISIMIDMGRVDEALPVCNKALQLRPDFAEIHNLLAIVLSRLGSIDDAQKSSRRAIELRPDFAPFYDTYGTILSEKGLMQDALDAYDKAIELNPGYTTSYYNRGNVLNNLGHFDEAETDYRKAMMLKPDHAEAHSNLLFSQASAAKLSHKDMLDEQKQWDSIHGEVGRLNTLSTRVMNDTKGARLRVGYISADFCMHPVGYFFEPLLVGHDRSKVEIFCYANMYESQADAVTHRLYKLSDHWQYVKGSNDFELAKLIHSDELDILVDLSGHTRGNRLKVFTYRPAPVQAMYLGYCASSGLQAMDYWITDEILHPSDTLELSSEKSIRLPRCSFCYQPPHEAGAHPERDFNSECVVFASYSHLSKLLPPVIEVWSKVLNRVPGSRMSIMDKYMNDIKTRDRLINQFESHGISKDRLIISGNLPYTDYYNSYSSVDIVLDPFPRTGGTTTADALWMGVPVVTLAGDRYAGRISASKLHAVGLDNLIADSPDQYVEIAARLAKDEDYRRSLRQELRNRMVSSELCDSPGLAEALEAAYTGMCASR